MNTSPMIVMLRPIARRAPSSTTSAVMIPTVTSICRGMIALAMVSMFHGTQAPTRMPQRISTPSIAQPRTPRGRFAGHREHQEAQHQDEAEVDRPLEEQAQRLQPGGVELEQRQGDAHRGDGAQHRARLRHARDGRRARLDRPVLGLRLRLDPRIRARVAHVPLRSAIVTRSCAATADSETVRDPTSSRWSTFGPPGRRM